MQKQETTIFKMSLTFTSEAAMKTTDLTSLKDDLMQACEEHNYQSENPIVLLSLHARRINLLINLKECEDCAEPTLKDLETFINILSSDLGWNRFGEPDRPLFQMTMKVHMTTAECKDLLLEGKKTFINGAHSNRFREWVQPFLPEKSRPRRNESRRPPFYQEEWVIQESDTMPLEDALEMLEGFVGLDALKAEVHNAIHLAKSLESESLDPQHQRLPYAFVIEKSKEVQLGHVLKLMAVIFSHLGFADDCVFDMTARYAPFMREPRLSANLGINVVEVNTEEVSVDRNQVFLKQVEEAVTAGPGYVFVFLMDEGKQENNKVYKSWLHRHLYCREVHLPSYTSHQLTLMAEKTASKRGFTFTDQARAELQRLIEAAADDKNHSFSILQVQQMVQEITTRHILEPTPDSGKKSIEAEDVEAYFQRKYPLKENEEQQKGSQSFNSLIGLETVKGKIEEIGHLLMLQKKMRSMGVEAPVPTFHMVFTGNPGTGKTVSARLVGEIFKEMGLLERGHFVEVGRDDLVGAYVGHTALRAKAKINEAKGGVLFIDEAYSLYSEGKVDYGHEAVATLVKEMENNRDNLVVILAGYPEDMDRLLKMNAGLKDRIPHKIHFPDYSAEELTAIFHTMLPEGVSATATGIDLLQRHFGEVISRNKDTFSNGRHVRNLWERIEQKRARRLANVKAPTNKQLLTITMKDVEAALADQDFNGTWEKTKNKPENPIGFGE